MRAPEATRLAELPERKSAERALVAGVQFVFSALIAHLGEEVRERKITRLRGRIEPLFRGTSLTQMGSGHLVLHDLREVHDRVGRATVVTSVVGHGAGYT
jgi:hypothetical protein